MRLLLLALLLSAPLAFAADGVSTKPFGKTPRGEEVTLYTLTNAHGMSVSIMDYGATVVKIEAPDARGKLDDVALGFDRLAPYLTTDTYFGATVGRYANRIANGRFAFGSTVFHLPRNNGPNMLHGGTRGFDKQVWKFEPVESGNPAVRFTLFSPDGDQGFPGNLYASVAFTLTDDNHLRIAYQATTDKTTVINLTNHTYFNLAGAGNGTILDHVLTLNADAFTPVDAGLIPTGEIRQVAGTPWDFTRPTPIGAHIQQTGGKPIGYDHNFILQKGFFSDFALAAEVDEPTTGRVLKVYTDQPGVQFYSGNFLTGIAGKGGKHYPQYSGFCLETQHYPDSPNHEKFPTTVLSPGDTYRTTTEYAFETKDPSAK